jgi:hypothetical protein
MMRREFIAGISSAVAWPVVARAQQAAMPVIGFPYPASEYEKAIALGVTLVRSREKKRDVKGSCDCSKTELRPECFAVQTCR